jgi:hypothetical protein
MPTTIVQSLWPSGAGDQNDLEPAGTLNWDRVNTEDETQYVSYAWANWYGDLYVKPVVNLNHGAAISKLTVYWRGYCTSGGSGKKGKLMIKSGGTIYYGADQSLSTTKTTYSTEWATDPATGVAWTEAGLNAAQVGIALYGVADGSAQSRCYWLRPDVSVSVPDGMSYARAVGAVRR